MVAQAHLKNEFMEDEKVAGSIFISYCPQPYFPADKDDDATLKKFFVCHFRLRGINDRLVGWVLFIFLRNVKSRA